MHFSIEEFQAIDPLALILSPAIYVKLHLPDPPPDEIIGAQVRQMLSALKGDERKQLLSRVKTIAAYANAVAKELAQGR